MGPFLTLFTSAVTARRWFVLSWVHFSRGTEWQAQLCPAEGLGWNAPCPSCWGQPQPHLRESLSPPGSAWAPAANQFHHLPQQNANLIMVIKIVTCHTPFTAPLMTSTSKNPPHTTREGAPSQPHQGGQYPPSVQFHPLPHHKNPHCYSSPRQWPVWPLPFTLPVTVLTFRFP